MTTILLIHGNQAVLPSIQAEAPGASVAVIYRAGGPSAYMGLVQQYPTLAALAQAHTSWQPGEPLVVMAFSSGGWALRTYLRSPQDRATASAAAFLDATYGTIGNDCDLSQYYGVIEYGRAGKPLVLTYSNSHPAPRICALAIAKESQSASVTVEGFPGTHDDQQYKVAPAVAGDLTQLVGRYSTTAPSANWLVPIVIGVVAGLGILFLRRG